MPTLLSDEFRELSARLGQDPLQVQGPGGNTSIKDNKQMWIKASGTRLASALTQDIFVAIDLAAARRAAQGDGSCKDTVIDKSITLRPSIETTFHAALHWRVVVHTHSVATLVHAISVKGRAALAQKLQGLPWAEVPYRKPGIELTREIIAQSNAETRVIVLHNHGLICCGETVEASSALLQEVESRLSMPPTMQVSVPVTDEAPDGYEWDQASSWLAHNARHRMIVTCGSYYPDHVVFLGPALPITSNDETRPAILIAGQGTLLRRDATPSQRAMLRCLSDVMLRLPPDWTPEGIGASAEASLLHWDAEKYRQALAKPT